MIVKLFSGVYANSDEIVYILPYGSEISKKVYAEKKQNGLLLNLTKGKATKSIVLLKNGLLISLNLRTDTVYKKMYEEKED